MWRSLSTYLDGSPLYIVAEDPFGVVTLRTLMKAWAATKRLSRADFDVAASTTSCRSRLCSEARFDLFSS